MTIKTEYVVDSIEDNYFSGMSTNPGSIIIVPFSCLGLGTRIVHMYSKIRINLWMLDGECLAVKLGDTVYPTQNRSIVRFPGRPRVNREFKPDRIYVYERLYKR